MNAVHTYENNQSKLLQSVLEVMRTTLPCPVTSLVWGNGTSNFHVYFSKIFHPIKLIITTATVLEKSEPRKNLYCDSYLCLYSNCHRPL